ncbi:hypothetical protein OB2597_13453 [Pseudooceanicola batsensis HTCC2597]|uniref:Uncharacterized protein n=1 Tax=Pseudooceanicola batsensis (strain ATCC BAA-863 / DSM 15984 / KCTC 12145 / HTCC2597) TaxID=252305 RepID=A3TYB9_PSEBH|nr:hypothetical protein [Pseudooceanicola batsensis]EAQ03153.1 hypothetical protein OB2597_13453 [Pseudooceanicola batsensis HTCC2597]
MAADGKKPITVDTTISMFAETRSKSAPDWFVARPKVAKLPFVIPVKKTMQLDPRKWKKSTIEQGVYAVARYELKVFDTALTKINKDLAKVMPKGKKFSKNTRDESKEETAALDKAASEVTSLHKKYHKAITDKVSLALDEVEADKGDNKRAIAAGRDAIRKFDSLDTRAMFSAPATEVGKIMTRLGTELAARDDGDDPGAFNRAHTQLLGVQKDFEATGKTTQNVIKFLLDRGAKMAKDKNAAPSLQQIGKEISANGRLKTAMTRLSAAIDEFDKELDATVRIARDGKGSGPAMKTWGSRFEKTFGGRDKTVKDAVAAVKLISQKFNKAMKDVKA